MEEQILFPVAKSWNIRGLENIIILRYDELFYLIERLLNPVWSNEGVLLLLGEVVLVVLLSGKELAR